MALTYNQPRFALNLLAKHNKSPPSFAINLYDDHWTLNKGPSKFLYTQPVSGLLDEVRALRIPMDFIEIFDMAHVPYYEGCMIVESIDHRKPRTNPQQTSPTEAECVRVVLQPNAESFYADLCLLNVKSGNKWTDQEALEVESKILNAICPPLCLNPDVNLTRIVNTVIRASTPSDTVLSKRKQVHEPEEDENDKAKRAKLWSQYMHPHHGKPSSQVQNKRSMFDILHEVAQKDEKGKYKLKQGPSKPEPALFHRYGQPQNNHTFVPPNAMNPMTAPPAVPSSAPTTQDDPKAKFKAKTLKKADAQDAQSALNKGKKKTISNPNVPPPQADSPALEQKKVGHVLPGVSRTPVDPSTMITASPKPSVQSVQFQQLQQASVSPQPPVFAFSVPSNTDDKQLQKQSALKKPDEQHMQAQAHQPQLLQAGQMEPQSTWQAPIPSSQYMLPHSKKKPAPQPQQASFQHTPGPGFSNGGFQNPGYKNPGSIGQNPNMNPNRGSPMSHNQPLLSRSPLPPHSQSPHPPPQQPQQAPPSVSHPAHQFNMHLPQNRFNATLQGQPGHHSPQHPVPQQHHAQHQNAQRAGQPPHDPAMMHAMQYNAMPQYQYSPMHMQGMMNGMRLPAMPGGQTAGGQFMSPQGWRVPPGGRGGGGGPMTTVPMGMAHGQHFPQQPAVLASLGRGQPQPTQPQGQGR